MPEFDPLMYPGLANFAGHALDVVIGRGRLRIGIPNGVLQVGRRREQTESEDRSDGEQGCAHVQTSPVADTRESMRRKSEPQAALFFPVAADLLSV